MTLRLDQLNVLIGANAAGKSNVLDTFRFLAEGVRDRDFVDAVCDRGGIHRLAWKGEAATSIVLETTFVEGARQFEWKLRLTKQQDSSFRVSEDLHEHAISGSGPPQHWLHADGGSGDWWWSPGTQAKVSLKLGATECALAAAARDDVSRPRRCRFRRALGLL